MAGVENRKNPRIQLVTRVRILSEGQQVLERISADISVGGIFIRINPPLPMGRRIRLVVSLPGGGGEIEAQGTVVWIRSSEDGSGRPPGIGVQFDDLSEEGRRAIEALVSRGTSDQS